MDIGDKSWGVTVCQKYFEKQSQNSGGSSSKLQFGPENTLHVGDQFLSAGANDFRARSVGTTAWIASPEETVYVYPPPTPPFYGHSMDNVHGKIHIFPSLSVSRCSIAFPCIGFTETVVRLALLVPVADNASQRPPRRAGRPNVQEADLSMRGACLRVWHVTDRAGADAGG